MKICKNCGQAKEIKDFYPQKGGKTGVMSRCKACHKANVRSRKLVYEVTLVVDYEEDELIHNGVISVDEQGKFLKIVDKDKEYYLYNTNNIRSLKVAIEKEEKSSGA